MSFKLGRADVDERQKVILVPPFDIQEVPFGEWQETHRAACHASPLSSDLGGEICLEPRQQTT